MSITCTNFHVTKGPVERGSSEYRAWAVCQYIVTCKDCGEKRLFGFEEDSEVRDFVKKWTHSHRFPEPTITYERTDAATFDTMASQTPNRGAAPKPENKDTTLYERHGTAQ
jgi:hypothetical protein